MIYSINGEQPFQVMADSFSVSPSESGYDLYLSADGVNYSNFATVASGVTRQFTGMNDGNYYRLMGNTSLVKVNWERDCHGGGGGGGTAGVSSLDGQTGALTLKTVNGNALLGSGDITISGSSSVSTYIVNQMSQQELVNLYNELIVYESGSSSRVSSGFPVQDYEFFFYKSGSYDNGGGFVELRPIRIGNGMIFFEGLYSGYDGKAFKTITYEVSSNGTTTYRDSSCSVFTLNGQQGALTLKTVNGNALLGSGDIQIEGGGGDYVVVEDLSAITNPVEGMIAYVPAHTVTKTGCTIVWENDDTDATLTIKLSPGDRTDEYYIHNSEILSTYGNGFGVSWYSIGQEWVRGNLGWCYAVTSDTSVTFYYAVDEIYTIDNEQDFIGEHANLTFTNNVALSGVPVTEAQYLYSGNTWIRISGETTKMTNQELRQIKNNLVQNRDLMGYMHFTMYRYGRQSQFTAFDYEGTSDATWIRLGAPMSQYLTEQKVTIFDNGDSGCSISFDEQGAGEPYNISVGGDYYFDADNVQLCQNDGTPCDTGSSVDGFINSFGSLKGWITENNAWNNLCLQLRVYSSSTEYRVANPSVVMTATSVAGADYDYYITWRWLGHDITLYAPGDGGGTMCAGWSISMT